MLTLWCLLSNSVWAYTVSGEVSVGTATLDNAAVYLFDVNQQYRETRSNDAGEFTFSDIQEGMYRIFVVPDVESNAIPAFYPNTPLYCDGARIAVDEDSTVDIHLDSGTTMNATLFVDNEPISGALVKISPDGAWTRGGFTAEDGTVWVGGLPPDTLVTVEVEGEGIPTQWIIDSSNSAHRFGYDDREADWIDLSEIEDSEWQLNPGISIGGLVHSGTTPIPNANLSIYSNSQIRTTQSDEDGLYFVEALPPGEVLSWMNADGYANTYSPSDDRPLYFEPILSEGSVYNLLDIDAPLESTLSITLLDAGTEEPIQGASVLLYNDTKTVGRGEPVDATGTASIVGLHAGSYTATIFAENDGYYNGDVETALGEPLWIEVGEQEQAELTVYWEPREQALISVIDDWGVPIADVLLLIQQVDGEDFDRQYTDSDGVGLMYGLQTGDWNLVVSYTPICPNDMGYIIPKLDAIQIPQTETIEVILLRDDDQDGMPTVWEEEWGLDPYRDDSAEDPDGDGLSNLQEYTMGSEPTSSNPVTECGCRDSKSALLFIPALFWVQRRRRG